MEKKKYSERLALELTEKIKELNEKDEQIQKMKNDSFKKDKEINKK